MHRGDPVRLSFVGSTAAASSSTIGIYLPGTNTAYTLQPSDFLVIDSLHCVTTTGAFVLSSTAGQTAVSQSTLLAAFSSTTGEWHANSEALSPPQGVQPSILGASGTPLTYLTGTGFLVRSPGYSQPWASTTGTPNPGTGTN